VFEASAEEIAGVEGISSVIAEKITTFDRSELDQEFEIADRGGARIITLFDEDYPEALNQLYDPPLVLYLRGRLPSEPAQWDKTIAIVGTRTVSNYGAEITRSIAEDAVASGLTPVSGLALGVDAIAHQAAVDAGSATIGVIAAGLMHFYPKENLELARKIVASGGAVVSEFPLRFPINRTNFPRRNRIVAALARALVVTEAGEKSGAMITAGQALELGKDIFAVPGRVNSAQHKGCHKLIKQGAGLIESFSDIAAALGFGFLSGIVTDPDRCIPDESERTSDLSAAELKVLSLLDKDSLSVDEIHEATHIEISDLLLILMNLEMKMLVRQEDINFFCRIH
jgi:DNA processing protein